MAVSPPPTASPTSAQPIQQLYAINAASGAVAWKYNTGSAIEFVTPAVGGGTVYVGNDGGQLHAVNASNGAKRWMFQAGGGIGSRAAIGNGLVYLGAQDHNLYAIDASSGAARWHYSAAETVGSPLVVGSLVCAASADGAVVGLDAGSGAFHWKFTTGGATRPALASTQGVVYMGSSDGGLYALSAATGGEDVEVRDRGRGQFTSRRKVALVSRDALRTAQRPRPSSPPLPLTPAGQTSRCHRPYARARVRRRAVIPAAVWGFAAARRRR